MTQKWKWECWSMEGEEEAAESDKLEIAATLRASLWRNHSKIPLIKDQRKIITLLSLCFLITRFLLPDEALTLEIAIPIKELQIKIKKINKICCPWGQRGVFGLRSLSPWTASPVRDGEQPQYTRPAQKSAISSQRMPWTQQISWRFPQENYPWANSSQQEWWLSFLLQPDACWGFQSTQICDKWFIFSPAQVGSPPTSQYPKGTIKALLDNRNTPWSANHVKEIAGAFRNLKLIFCPIQKRICFCRHPNLQDSI